MKYKAIVCAIAAASLGLGSLSTFAQGRGNDRDRDGRPDHNQRDNNGRGNGNGHGNNGRGNDSFGHDNRNQDMGGRGNDRSGYYYGARGPEWRRGGHVPYQYRGNQYVVNDWRGHHLNAPPRGQQWVQVGGDYVLVAIATGIIVQLLLNQ